MKKFLVLFSVWMSSAFSSGQPFAYDLLFTSMPIDSSAKEAACETYSQYFLDSLQKEKFIYDCADGAQGIGFNSLLDSTVRISFEGDEGKQFFGMARISQECVGPYPEDSTVGTPGTHQFSEVMLFELLRFQECGIVKISRDSLETLLQSVISLMKEKNRRCPDLDLGAYDESSGEAGSLFGPGCCSLVESSEAIPRISQVSPGVRVARLSPGKFRLSGVPLGTELSVFNLKGQLLLRKNFDGGLLETPNVPAVARVGGSWVKLE